MVDAAAIPSIRQILSDYEVKSYLEPKAYAELVAALENRENVMVADLGPRMYYMQGLAKIIDQA